MITIDGRFTNHPCVGTLTARSVGFYCGDSRVLVSTFVGLIGNRIIGMTSIIQYIVWALSLWLVRSNARGAEKTSVMIN
jgi:hypothetical protein